MPDALTSLYCETDSAPPRYSTVPAACRRRGLLSSAAIIALVVCAAMSGWLFTGNSSDSRDSLAVATPVSVNTGRGLTTKSIEDIRQGDLVLARDEHGTEIGYRQVAEVYRRVSNHLRHLTFRDDQTGRQQTLKTTDEHPFWSVNRNEWIPSGELKPGEQVTSPSGQTQKLIATHRTEHTHGVPVFNFQVTDYHTYYVAQTESNTPLLVHNADHGYRVMSQEEFAGAQNGIWADSRLVAKTDEAGSKWLWTNQKGAEKWKTSMEAAGETDLVITRVPLLKGSGSLPKFPHAPQGTAMHVPFSQLGSARLAQ